MRPRFNKRLLQIVVALLSLVPTIAGAAGILIGPAFVAAAPSDAIDLDSHFRYLSGLLLTVGLMFYATIPSIERKTSLFRLAALLVVGGGIARLVSLPAAGMPSPPHLAGLALELTVTPLLVVWQARVASETRAG